MPSVLKLKFSYRFNSPIWESKTSDRYLLINNRNSDSFESSFSLIDLNESQLLWEGLRFEEEWWVSVYHMTDQVIVFQQFEDTQDIDNRSVFGFDSLTQESLWSMENVHLSGASGDQLFMNSGEEESLIFNIHKKDWDSERHQSRVENGIEYPIHYEKDNKHFDTVARFLKSKQQIELIGSCDYLESHDLIFIAANHVFEGKKSLSLYVFDESGRLLLDESLESGVKGLVSGAFFIAKEALIFVTGKNELKIYSINEKV